MILGIAGTNGAGKGTVVDVLVERKGFTHYSMRDLIVEEIEKRGLEVNRTTMGMVGTDLRRIHEPHYFTKVFMDRAREAGKENIIIESIRSVAEAENIRSHGGYIVAVDAPRRIRYERIASRGTQTDAVTFEEFCEQEDREMTPQDPNDPTQMNMKKIIETADYTLVNEGTLEELQTKIDEMITTLGH